MVRRRKENETVNRPAPITSFCPNPWDHSKQDGGPVQATQQNQLQAHRQTRQADVPAPINSCKDTQLGAYPAYLHFVQICVEHLITWVVSHLMMSSSGTEIGETDVD